MDAQTWKLCLLVAEAPLLADAAAALQTLQAGKEVETASLGAVLLVLTDAEAQNLFLIIALPAAACSLVLHLLLPCCVDAPLHACAVDAASSDAKTSETGTIASAVLAAASNVAASFAGIAEMRC